jgi:(1->4)-alpha-D-glucan 1-alpha-D-glucosylmutase
MVTLADSSCIPTVRSRPLAGPPQIATYRLQLHAGFGFADAAARVPYLRRLGVSHLYLSPVLPARAGSTHGYDVVDPSHANPALGGDASFDALAEAARAHGMGIVLDVVPNHMGTGDANPYWDDVLAFGRESPYARWFDVAWEHLARIGRRQLVLPVLGDTLEAVLARGELTLAVEPRGVRVRYYEHSLPLDPRTVHRLFAFHHEYAFSDARHADAAEVLLLRDALAPERGASLARGDAERAVRALGERAARVPAIGAYVEWALRRFAEGDDGRYRLTALLDLQHWRLTHWRRAWRELNYRRFFDISDLVALRAEDPRVFEATHRWTLERVARGQVHAVRVDHVDGLRDPLAYLRRLRAALDARAPGGAHVPVYVEKILTAGERLPTEWPVDGTTGYEALNDLEAPLVDAAGFAAIEAAYRRTVRLKPAAPGFAEVAVRGKELVLRTAFRPEIRRAVRALVRVARAERADLPPPVLAEAVLRLAAALPVYRSYVTADEAGRVHASAEDRAVVGRAVERALPRAAGDERAAAALRFVAAVLTGDLPGADAPPAARQAAAEFALRFQQTSGPATAKGVEDTALYRWTPLASLNEVGGEPDRDLATSVAALHAANAERAAHWPRALVTVTTHDTKRSADARARLDALTAYAERWTRCVRTWRRRHAPLRPRVASARGLQGAPDANLAWLLYQSFACVWPAGVAEPDAATRDALATRLAAYAEKAAREAKTHTSWVDPAPEFEQAVAAFVDALARGEAGAPFRAELAALLAELEPTARRITLVRTALHLLGPGTPDVYQGDEHRLLALVDPDNRRAVDFDVRAAALEQPGGESADAEKLALVRACLALRAAHAEAFAAAGYVPLDVEGADAGAVAAFARVHGPWALLVAVERPASRAGAGWGEDTVLRLPASLAGLGWQPVAGIPGPERPLRADEDGALSVGALVGPRPLAVLLAAPIGARSVG